MRLASWGQPGMQALIDDERLASVRAADGTLFEEEARQRGWLGDRPEKFEMGAFVELHIEQGPVLEREGLQVGIVTSVQGLKWLDVEVGGMDAHAGTTPLDQRQDALLASARMLVALHEAGRRCGTAARVSVGRLRAATDGPSTMLSAKRPSSSTFAIPNSATLAKLCEECATLCREIGKKSGCAVGVEERISVPPVEFEAVCVDVLERGAIDRGYAYRRMTSGACTTLPMSPRLRRRRSCSCHAVTVLAIMLRSTLPRKILRPERMFSLTRYTPWQDSPKRPRQSLLAACRIAWTPQLLRTITSRLRLRSDVGSAAHRPYRGFLRTIALNQMGLGRACSICLPSTHSNGGR